MSVADCSEKSKSKSSVLSNLCTKTLAQDRPQVDEVLLKCEEGRMDAGDLVYPSLSATGLDVVELLPGEALLSSWRIVPKFQLNFDDIEFGQQVAEGGFSFIYKGKYHDQIVCIKKPKIEASGMNTVTLFQSEAEILASLFHPNIVELVGITIFPALYIVTPWAAGGSLDKLLYNQEWESCVLLPDSLKFEISAGILRGVHYLHSMHILHRDLKCSNVLLGPNNRPMLSDFGLSALKQLKERRKCSSVPDLLNSTLIRTPDYLEYEPVKISHSCGTWPWQAPEIMACLDHSEAADIFSLGMTLWEIWAQAPPFAHLSVNEIKQLRQSHAFIRPPLDTVKLIPIDLRLLISLCLQIDPMNRPTMSQLMSRLSGCQKYALKKSD